MDLSTSPSVGQVESVLHFLVRNIRETNKTIVQVILDSLLYVREILTYSVNRLFVNPVKLLQFVISL